MVEFEHTVSWKMTKVTEVWSENHYQHKLGIALLCCLEDPKSNINITVDFVLDLNT